jgi:Zn-dependent M28 family amino/carboxypeptidase
MTPLVRAPLLALGVATLCVQAFLWAQAPAPETVIHRVDRARLIRDVTTLTSPAFEGRSTGTPGALKVRRWLMDEFREAGLTPGGTDGFLQPFTLTSRDSDAAPASGSSAQVGGAAANVIGLIPGRERQRKLLVITAHHDHLGIRDGVLYPGADDNASGVAVLLAAARHFVRNPPRHPMMFAALDAEEIGLRGARALIDSPVLPRNGIALAINLDMVSRSAANEIFAAGTYHTPWLTPLLEDVQRRSVVRIRLGHDRPTSLASGLEDWTQLSDHGPFHEAGVPFVYFGVEDHGDHHKPSDTADRIDPRFFGDTADMIVDAVRTFDTLVD